MGILVIGGAGFVGKYLLKELELTERNIYVIDKRIPKEFYRYKTLNIDISSKRSLQKINKNIDTIINLAAFIPKDNNLKFLRGMIDVNVLCAKNILEFAKKNNIRVIFSSSASIYGYPVYLPVNEEHPKSPNNFYALTKLMSDMLCEEYEKKEVDCIWLRYSSIYGKNSNTNSVINKFIEKANKKENLLVFNKNRTQDFVYVKDVIQANIKSLKKGNGAFNIGSGKEKSMIELAEKINAVFGNKNNISVIKEDEHETRFCLDIKKAKSILGYKVNYDLERGLWDIKNNLE